MKLKLIAIACLSVTLVACGGGGGGGGGNGGTVVPSADLSLSARVNGVAVANFTVNSGENKVLGINSGQQVEITATTPTAFGPNLNGAVETGATKSDTVYRATLTAVDHTIAKLTFTALSDPRKTATVTLSIKSDKPDFNPVIPVVNDTFVYSENVVQVNNAPFAFGNTTRRVDSVSGTGWVETYLTPQNVPIANVSLTREGNRTSYVAVGAAAGCNNVGNKVTEFKPEERLLAFPLTLNKVYSGDWVTTCAGSAGAQPADSQNEHIDAQVLRFEPITTPAGVFNAMLINQDTVVTNSTNTALPGGGYRQNVRVWFDPVLGRNVKYVGTRTYTGSPAGTLVKETTIELVSISKQ